MENFEAGKPPSYLPSIEGYSSIERSFDAVGVFALLFLSHGGLCNTQTSLE
jgi:hypothetical protein